MRHSPVNIWVGNDEKGEASLPIERALVLEGVCLVLCLVQPLGHHLVEHGHLGHQRRLLGARVLHRRGRGARHRRVTRRHAPGIAGFAGVENILLFLRYLLYCNISTLPLPRPPFTYLLYCNILTLSFTCP